MTQHSPTPFSTFLIIAMIGTFFTLHRSNASDSDDCPAPTQSSTETNANLEISAVYPNPNSGESEWIELTNQGSTAVDLKNYTLEDSTEKPWTLSGTLEESLTIMGFPFQLNNSGDTVNLKNTEGVLIDSWTFDASEKGEILNRSVDDSASTASLPEDTPSDPESSPVSSSENSADSFPTETPSLWPVFSEAIPNPEGSDSSEEWIELYNLHEETLDLSGLQVDDAEGGSDAYSLSGTLAPESYLVLYSIDTDITLNNDSDHIRLLGVDEEILWDISYSDSTEGWSYAVFGTSYEWTSELTPGKENIASEDSSENDTEEESKTSEESTETSYQDGDVSDELEITEVYPDPEGSDAEEEWIEITNGGEEAVNLGNWTITDGSKTYTFSDDTVIQPGETIILYRSETQLALNNSQESLSMSDYSGEVIDSVSYENAEEGESYAEIQIEEVESLQASTLPLGNKKLSTWQWVTPSPGVLNPVWKQVQGMVKDWDEWALTLSDGSSEWVFHINQASALDPLIYEIGNQILVQAAGNSEGYELMHAELLSPSTIASKEQAIPWEIIALLSGIGGYAGWQVYKKRKNLQFDLNPVP